MEHIKTTYKCKENNIVLQFHSKKRNIDEVWIQIEGEIAWAVVGYKDLLKGITKAQKKFKLKDSHSYGGGYIGEALYGCKD